MAAAETAAAAAAAAAAAEIAQIGPGDVRKAEVPE